MSNKLRIVRLSPNLWINLNHLVAVIPVDRNGGTLMVTLWDGAQRTCIHVKEGSDEARVLERALDLFDLRMPASTKRQSIWFRGCLIYLDEGYAPVLSGTVKRGDRVCDRDASVWEEADEEIDEPVDAYVCVTRPIPKD
jgi:hypothetical protein